MDHERHSFECRLFTIAPGDGLAYRQAEWEDALVVVEHGVLELEGTSGTRYLFACGAILSLADMPLRALHCCGPRPVILLAVSRRPR